jgi:hypothetical protein
MLLAWWAFAAGCSGCGEGGDPAVRERARFRVATWNVRNLFDEIDRREAPGADDTVLSAGAPRRRT